VSIEFILRRTRQRGKLIGAQRNQEVRGRLSVDELKDDEPRRTVRMVTFAPSR